VQDNDLPLRNANDFPLTKTPIKMCFYVGLIALLFLENEPTNLRKMAS